jgi:hypothetical protein
MDIRHNFIAHRGDNENEQAMVYFSLSEVRNKSFKTKWNVKSLRANNFQKETIEKCEELFSVVNSIVQTKLYDEIEKLHNYILTINSAILKTWLIE